MVGARKVIQIDSLIACNRFTLFLDSKERGDLLHSTAEVETAVWWSAYRTSGRVEHSATRGAGRRAA
jgi:hypothetical protein